MILAVGELDADGAAFAASVAFAAGPCASDAGTGAVEWSEARVFALW